MFVIIEIIEENNHSGVLFPVIVCDNRESADREFDRIKAAYNASELTFEATRSVIRAMVFSGENIVWSCRMLDVVVTP